MNIEHLHSRIGDLAPWRCRHSALLTVSRNTGTTDRQRQQTVQPGLSGIRCTVREDPYQREIMGEEENDV